MITPRDILDIDTCIKLEVDYIVVPYVESKEDLQEVRELFSRKGRSISIIVKLQTKKVSLEVLPSV